VKAPQIRLLLVLVTVLGFAAWAMGLTWSVRGLRHQVEEQVGWLITVSAWERDPGDAEVHQEVLQLVPDMRVRLATSPEAHDVLDAVETSLLGTDSAAQQRAAQRLSPLIRRANAQVSAALGSRWDQVMVLVFLGMAFAFAALLQMALRQQEQEALASSERALKATEDRLARVGVGLLCIDDDNTVRSANEVARGLAAAEDSVDDWWRAVDQRMRRPGAVPCRLCARPAHVGRTEVQDSTRMGQRVLEVVFGGHAHDLEHGEQLVVLIRDITDQRRRLVLGGVAERMSDSRQLSQGVARALTGRAMRLVRGLRAMADDLDDSRVDEAIAVGEELRELGRSVGVFANDQEGPCDVAATCRAAAALVRPQLPKTVDLNVIVPEGLEAHVRPGRFAQALFTQLLRSADACRDGRDHTMTLAVSKEGSTIRVDLIDDRDPESPRSVPAPLSATEELFQAAGARFTRADADGSYVATIRVAAVE